MAIVGFLILAIISIYVSNIIITEKSFKNFNYIIFYILASMEIFNAVLLGFCRKNFRILDHLILVNIMIYDAFMQYLTYNLGDF